MMVVLVWGKPGLQPVNFGESMCLAMPAKIIQILDNHTAIVEIGGIQKEISTILIEDKLAVNDYVILHVGYALTKLNEVEAKKTLAIFAAMQREEIE